MVNRLFCSLCLGAFLGLPLLVSGCSGFQANKEAGKQAERAPESGPQSAAELAETVEADSVGAQEPAAIARRTVADDITQLLADAEAALAADRLTTPIHDNAFDRFQAVLLLRPDNEQAKSGLQQVFSRYVGMVRSALRRNQPGTARALIERARLVNRDHPILAELVAEIAVGQKRLAEQSGVNDVTDEEKEILLDVGDLDQRDETVVEQLKSLATQIRQSDETMLIVARNDAEGRWIYQRMSEGVPNYRLRGDIRLGRVPKILLLPPIDN